MIPRSFNFFVDLSSIVAPSTILVRTFFLNPKLRNYEGFRSKSIPILANLSLLFERWKENDEIDEANFQRTTKTAWKKKKKKTSRLSRARSCSRLLVSNLGILNALPSGAKLLAPNPHGLLNFSNWARPLRTSAPFFRFFASFFANFSGYSIKFL